MDDEDDSKFSKLIRPESEHAFHLVVPSWIPTESHRWDSVGAMGAGNNEDRELIGSSNYQIKNGYLFSGLVGNFSVI